MTKGIEKILASKAEMLDDGRIVIVPDMSDWSDLVDELNALFLLHSVVGRSEQLKAFEQGETLFLDNTLKVEVITPESSVLVKDSRDNKMMWVEKGRLKRH